MAKITKPFFYQNCWFYAGDEVEGPTATAAIAAGAAKEPAKPPRKAKKDLGAAPENKMTEASDGDV